MSADIPILAVNRVSDRAKKTLDIVKQFVEERCIPADPIFAAQVDAGGDRWDHHPTVLDDLKVEAKKLGLWNMFLAKGHYKEGAGFTNLEYGLMAEYLGKSRCASERSTVLRPTLETWRCWRSMAMRHRRRSGCSRFWMVRSGRLS